MTQIEANLITNLTFFAGFCFCAVCIVVAMVIMEIIKKLPSDDFDYTPVPPTTNGDDDGEAWKRGGINPNNN